MNVCFWSYWAQYATRNAVQILTIDKMVTLVEMQDFYLKKRKRHAVLNNVIWCHLLHWVSFLFCKKTQDMVLISCNFSNLSWNLINHTQFFKYQYINSQTFSYPRTMEIHSCYFLQQGHWTIYRTHDAAYLN